MHLIVYGDFNCPYSYLASQRADALVRACRAEVEWRAVEHDRRLALTGTRSGSDPARWQRELAEVAALAGLDEQAPGAAPALVSNTGAAVAACAEAVTDGVQDELRRSLFSEIWVRLRHVSGPSEVRQLVRAADVPGRAARRVPRRTGPAGPDPPPRRTQHAPAPVRLHDQPGGWALDRRRAPADRAVAARVAIGLGGRGARAQPSRRHADRRPRSPSWATWPPPRRRAPPCRPLVASGVG